MKKLWSVLMTGIFVVTAVVLLSFHASAATSGTTGDCTWTLDGTVLTISGEGAMEDYYTYTRFNTPWCYLEYTSVIIGDGVTHIGEYAFYRDGITTITIPDSVMSIGRGAFFECSNLDSVVIGTGLKSIGNSAFYQCYGISKIYITDLRAWCEIDFDGNIDTYYGKTLYLNGVAISDLVIPDGVKTIGRGAFQNCVNLTSISLPDSVTSIEYSAFRDCDNLRSVMLGSGIEKIGSNAFEACYELKQVYINDLSAWCEINFADDTSNPSVYGGTIYLNGVELKGELIIPETVTKIGPHAFRECDYFTSIIIPNGVITIGDYAFSYCTSLTSVTIGDGVVRIGEGAFNKCTALTSVSLSESVSDIAFSAFEGCTSLSDIIVDSKNPIYSSSEGVLFDKNKTTLISCPGGKRGSYVIPESVTSIGDDAFSGCTRLTSITIPNSVTRIGFSAFYGCTGLTEMTLPFVGGEEDSSYNTYFSFIFGGSSEIYSDYVPRSLKKITITKATKIDSRAFYNCKSLISITIPDSVTNIGDDAFYNCKSLTSITIPDSVTNIGDDAFYDCTSLTSITIPDSVTNIGDDAFYNTGYYNDTANWGDDVLYIGKYLIRANASISESCIVKNGTLLIANYAFENCTSLTSITIPNSVTSIEKRAFKSCTGLTSITIPDSVMSIGESAFYNCTGLTEMTLPFVGETIDGTSNTNFKYIFDSEGNVPSNLIKVTITKATKIDSHAFHDCTSLTSITIPDSVTSIGESAFEGCAGLTSITIPNSVTRIGFSAFYDCTGLTEMTLPFVGAMLDGVEGTFFGYIFGAYSHSYNETVVPDSLKKVTITKVTKIDSYAFYNCESLMFISIPKSVMSIGTDAFYGTGYYNDTENWENEVLYIGKHLIKVKTSVSRECFIKAGTLTIADEAFLYCTNLTSVSIPESVVNIGKSAFSNCLEKIWYIGSSEQKEGMAIDSSNEALLSAPWHFNCCSIHTFDSECDENCNLCEYTRDGIVDCDLQKRNSDQEHWMECIRCHKVVEREEHAYSYICDESCDFCTYIRIPADCTYDSLLDDCCNICGEFHELMVAVKKDISEATISGLSSTYTYSGYPKEPSVRVYIGEEELTYLKDYDIQYFNNTNLGTGTVRIIGLGDYIGYKEASFSIVTPTPPVASTFSIIVRDPGWQYKIGTSGMVSDVQYGAINLEDENLHFSFGSALNCYYELRTSSGLVVERGSSSSGTIYFSRKSTGTYTLYCEWYGKAYSNGVYYPGDFYQNTLTIYNTAYTVVEPPEVVYPSRIEPEPPVVNDIRHLYLSVTAESGKCLDDITWTSDDSMIAEVNGGIVELKKHGSVRISASVNGVTTYWDLTIDALDLSSAEIIYDPYLEQFCVYFEKEMLIEGKDYTLTSEIKNGIKKIKVSGCGLFAGQIEGVFDEDTNEPYHCNHQYDDACDTICNICEEVRNITHTYSNDCDAICNVCQARRSVGEHRYTNVCDPSCNECGTIRTIEGHKYTNVCDATCDKCGETRTVEGHQYTNVCDATCDKCGERRTIEGHKYTNVCDAICNKCGESRMIEGHKYTNVCDAICDKCGESRTVEGHKYTNVCDATCDKCGERRTVEGHKYTNSCDTFCDKCGATRTITHSYSHGCDATCNVCGATRTVAGHSYTHDCDTTCNTCDAVRTVAGHKYTNACDTACDICGASRSITHAYGDYVYNGDGTAAKDGTKTRVCSVCGAKDTVTAVGTKLKNPFKDVKNGEYYTDPVLWAVGKGITNGTSATTFGPNDQCTRGQIVTFLWRAAGSPEPTSTKNPFKDVKSDQYYYKAVLWAVEKGITNGTSATTFSPNATCTRGQVVTFLWRAKGKPSATASTSFKDVKSGQYYTEAVAWAVKNNITTGISATQFAPDATCTRGQIVTFLYRAYK